MTALDFWRKAYPTYKSPCVDECMMPRGAIISTEEELWSLAPALLTPAILRPEHGIVHVTVLNRSERRRSNTHMCHLWQNEIPYGSFYQLADSTFIASPQLIFAQMSQSLNLEQLIALGFEICGLYSIDDDSPFGMREREKPLVTVQELHDYLDELSSLRCTNSKAGPTRGPYGIRKAKRALSYVVERSGSPRETIVTMMLCLPYRLGGYGIKEPLLNHELRLIPKAADIANRRNLRADLLWKKERFIIEFNGSPHMSESAVLSDRARTNALQLMDFTVMELTSEQLNNPARFDAIAQHIAKALGKYIDPAKRGVLPERMRLRNEIFTWTQTSGRVL